MSTTELKLNGTTVLSENAGVTTLSTAAAGVVSLASHTTQVSNVSGTAGNINFTTPNAANVFTVKTVDAAITDSQSGTAPDISDSNSGQLAIYNGTTKLWGITEHGYVIKPNIPHFWVYSAGNNFSAPGSYTVFNFNNAHDNPQGMYDLTTDTATAPVSGLYQFIFWTNVYGANGYNMIQRLQRNGTDDIFGTMSYIGVSGDTTYNMSHIYKLNAGDYVQAAWKVGAGTVSNGSPYNGFIGYLIG